MGNTQRELSTCIVPSRGEGIRFCRAQATAVSDGYRREVGAAHLGTHHSELSRLRHGDLRRFSLTRIVRFIARMGYDVEVHLKRTPRREEHPQPRRPLSSVVRYEGQRGSLAGHR